MRSTTLYIRPPEKVRKSAKPKTARQEIRRAVFRYRMELLPIFLAFWLAMVTAWIGPRVPWFVPVVLVVLAGVTYRYGDRFPKVALKRHEWRVYVAVVCLLAGAWSYLSIFWTLDGKPSLKWLMILALGTFPIAYPWLRHRRIRGSVAVTFDEELTFPARKRYGKLARKAVVEWETFVRASAASGSNLKAIHFDPWSVTLKVRLGHAKVAEDFTELRLRRIESAFEATRGSARVSSEPGKSSRLASITFMLSDPHAEAIIPTEDDLTPDEELTIDIGRFENGRHVIIDLIHTLIGGASGAGKSGILNAIMRGLARKENVAVCGIDLKPGGLELGKWSDVMYAVATTGVEAKVLLQAIIAGINRRGALMNERKIRKWKPTKEEPFVVLIIDEVQELKQFKGLFQLVTDVSCLGRAYGFAMILATQHPKDTQVPTTAIANCLQKIGLQCEASTAERLIFGDMATREGWRLTTLPGDREGSFLIRSKRYRHPLRARAHWIDDDMVERETTQWAPFRTAIDDGTWRGTIKAGTTMVAIEDGDEDDGRTDVVDAVIVESGPDDLVFMCIASGTGTPEEIAKRTGIPVRTVYTIIKRLADEGAIMQPGKRKPWIMVQSSERATKRDMP